MADEKPHLHVEFYTEAVQDMAATRKAGIPKFKDEEYVRIRIAGDPKNTLVAPAHVAIGTDRETGESLTYAKKFPLHYEHFKRGLSAPLDGIPIAELPGITASKVKELQASNIMTVEALASIDGSLLQKLGMGARELKTRAAGYLDKAAAAAGTSQLAAKLEEQEQTIASLRAQIEAMAGGKPVEEIEPQQSDADDSLGEESPFWAWDDPDIKAWIKDNNGTLPSGNASHKTLVARADALNSELAAKQAA